MKKVIAIVLVVATLLSVLSISAFAGQPGFAYDESVLNEFTPKWDSIQADETVISLTPGATVGEIRFAWLSNKGDDAAAFKFSENEDMSDATSVEVSIATKFSDYQTNHVTVNGLEEGKTYYYSYTENGVWSEAASFTVQPDDEFTVLYVSDAQIGRSGDENEKDVLVRDTCGWNYTVKQMLSNYPNATFAIHGGDQFESADSITQMKAYLSPEELRSLPVANTIGNHDHKSNLYSQIFNNPNEVFTLTASDAGYGYYYNYGDVLFITIDSNNTTFALTRAQKLLRKAVKAYPDAKWRVVTMHHDPYSASLAEKESNRRRVIFSSLFDCYDIDLVLCGHDHFYSRTEVMYQGKQTDGEGTVYLQSSSASGSDYDPLPEELASFVTTAFDTRVPTYTALTFTDDAIVGTTYRTDSEEVIDSFEVADNTTNSKTNIFSVLITMFKTYLTMDW